MEAIFVLNVRDFDSPASQMGELMINKDFQYYLNSQIGKQLTVTLSPTVKTTEKERMYAFYHKVVLSAAIKAFTDAGWEAVDKVKADYMLKAECAKGIMYNKVTGQEEVYLEDKSAMSKDRLYKYISDCIFLLETELGIKVPDSSGFGREDNEGFIST